MIANFFLRIYSFQNHHFDKKLEVDINNDTATRVHSPKAKGEVFVPRSITYDSKEYVINNIKEGSFKGNMQIRIFKFAEDSEMPTIEKETFALSSIMRISLTPHIKEINNYTFY